MDDRRIGCAGFLGVVWLGVAGDDTVGDWEQCGYDEDAWFGASN
jgi:hypothetical protein